MHSVYGIVVGPLAWLAGAVFILGSAYRFWSVYSLTRKKDPLVLEYMSLKYGLRSILRWSVPFIPVNSRRHPVVTVFTFLFHLCLLFVPVFLLAHVVMWQYYHDISFWSPPEWLTDLMTLMVVTGCIFFGIRRAVRHEVRYVTSVTDWVILAIVALPYLTGFLAYHQIGPYKHMIILHILSGEVMLAAIPFTRLSHMLFTPFTRAYIGSEFGAVRNAVDW